MGSRTIIQDDLAIKQLKKCVVLISKNAGFDEAEKGAVDDMTEILLDYIATVVQECHGLAVLGGRNAFNLFDISDSLDCVDISQNLEALITYLKDHKFKILPEKTTPKEPRFHEVPTLRIGDEKPMPSYIPSYLPKFPNPHTYIRTEVANDIEINYPRAREILAENKRNSENSLYRYALSTHDNFCLFQMQYEEELDKAKSDVDKQQAERLAKRARYNDDVNIDDFETVDTPETLVKRFISDDFFVLKPFPLSDPTMLAIVDPLEDEEEDPKSGNLSNDDSDDEIDLELENDSGSVAERMSDDQDHHDSKLSDTQEELIVSDSDEDNLL